MALNAGLEGECVAQFYIRPSGRMSDVEIKNKIGRGCSTAAFKGLEKMRLSGMKWVPGIINKQEVPILFTLPIVFSINDKPTDERNYKLSVGDKMPNFELPNTDGIRAKLYDNLGKVTFIYFEDRSTAYTDASVENRRYLKEIYKNNHQVGFDVCHVNFFRFTHREFTLDPIGNYNQAKRRWKRQMKFEEIPWTFNVHEAVNHTEIVCENLASDINNTGVIVDEDGVVKHIINEIGMVPILLEEVLNDVERAAETDHHTLTIYINGQ